METLPKKVAQIFWGLVLVGVDFRLGRFDIIPDFVGYGLLALGAVGLVGWSRQFDTARIAGWILVPISAAPLVFQGAWIRPVWMLGLVLDGVLMWYLLGGIRAFAASRRYLGLATWASLSRGLYVGVLAAGLVIGWFAPALPTLARLLLLVTQLVSWAVLAAILYLVFQVKGVAASENGPAPTTGNGSNTSATSTTPTTPVSAPASATAVSATSATSAPSDPSRDTVKPTDNLPRAA